MSGHTIDQPVRPSAAAKPVQNKHWDAASLEMLNAKVLLGRLDTVGEDSKNGSGWPEARARILQQKPRP